MLSILKRRSAPSPTTDGPTRASQETDDATLTEFSRMAHEMGVGGAYERKVALLNKTIKEDIGFGHFQIWLTWLAGFGWFVDNIWFQALSMSLPQIKLEFGPKHVQFATLALYLGLLIGATFWGFMADVIGRRPSWNITLFISAVFGVAVGGAPNFVALGALLSCLGLGLGGNLPVDGAMLIEFIPSTHQWILTFLSIFWCFGQLFAAFIGWAFITNYRCETAADCPKSSNMGWRYTWFLLGGITFLMWVARFWVYPIPESPKYLIGKGRDEEAMEVIKYIAAQNGKTTSLTLEQLKAAGEGVTMAINTLDANEKKLAREDDVETKANGAWPSSTTEEERRRKKRTVLMLMFVLLLPPFSLPIPPLLPLNPRPTLHQPPQYLFHSKVDSSLSPTSRNSVAPSPNSIHTTSSRSSPRHAWHGTQSSSASSGVSSVSPTLSTTLSSRYTSKTQAQTKAKPLKQNSTAISSSLQPAVSPVLLQPQHSSSFPTLVDEGRWRSSPSSPVCSSSCSQQRELQQRCWVGTAQRVSRKTQCTRFCMRSVTKSSLHPIEVREMGWQWPRRECLV